jgi:hypothetical protein
MKNWFLVPALLISFTNVHAASLPSQGMTMAAVQKTYGMPNTKTKAVGHPPITRWIYPDYTVVFEYKHVVQSVRMVKEDAPVTITTTPQETPSQAPAANEATLQVEVQQ